MLYRIDMIENSQLNLLFVNIKDEYMKSAAVNTQGRDIKEVVSNVTKAFYSEVYVRLYVFKLHSTLYKMHALLFIQWHLSDLIFFTSVWKFLQFTAHRKIMITFNWDKHDINRARDMKKVLNMMNDQIEAVKENHCELKEYLIYWCYIISENMKVSEKVIKDEVI